jgi:hypothetical protein
MQARRLKTLTAAAKDVEQALETFRRNFGFPVARRSEAAAGKGRSAFLTIGGAEIELAESDTGSVGEMLRERGEGLCQLELEVDDLETARRELKDRGIEADFESNAAGRRVLRVNAAQTHGVPLILTAPSRR